MSDSDYPWEVIPDPAAGGYVIRFPDLPGCMSQVKKLSHVNGTAAEIRDLWLETARAAGMAIPEPGSYEANVRRLRKLERLLRPFVQLDPDSEEPIYLLDGANAWTSEDAEKVQAIGRLLYGQND